jgi:hypothetical protein
VGLLISNKSEERTGQFDALLLSAAGKVTEACLTVSTYGDGRRSNKPTVI